MRHSFADVRRALLKKAPFFLDVLYALVPIADERIPTLGVDPSLLLIYNPAFLGDRPLEEAMALLWHECMHVITTFPLLPHLPEEHKGEMLNLAADLAINSKGLSLLWRLPPEGVFPKDYGFPELLSTLEYLEKLKSKGGKGSGHDHAGCAGGNCGIPKDLLEQHKDRQRPAAVLRAAVRATLQKSASHSEGRGLFPAGLEELISPAERETPWEEKFRACLRGTMSKARGYDHFSYSKTHRRSFLGDEVLLPGGVAESPDFGVVIDTSGSMSHALLQSCLGEVQQVLRETGAESCWLYQADVDLVDAREVSVDDLRNFPPMKGRGGTSFSHPLRKILERQDPVGALLYLTDGWGDPVPAFPLPLIWGVFTDAPAEWVGEVVRVKE